MYKLKESKNAVEEKFTPSIMSHIDTEDSDKDKESEGIEVESEAESEAAESEAAESEAESEESEESEAAEINPKSIYEYDGKQYYVDNEKLLQKRFDELDPTKKYTMNLCIYKCIRKGCCPYLTYLLMYDISKNTFVFPNYETDSMNSEEEQMTQHLFDIYPPNKTVALDMENEDPTDLFDEDLYKGFFLDESNESITMVYDATRINVPVSETDTRRYCWVSPYEIFVTNKMKDIAIDESVISTFASISKENKTDFHHLKLLADNTIVKTPYILFMCKNKNSSAGNFSLFSMFGANSSGIVYENVLTDNLDTETVLYPRIQHPNLGNYTFFSMEPIGKLSQRNRLQRFAVFVDIDELNPLYIEDSEIDKLLHLYDMDQTVQYSAVSFMHEGTTGEGTTGEGTTDEGTTEGTQPRKIQLWCVKSPYYFTEMANNILNDYIDEISVLPPADVVEQEEQSEQQEELEQPEEQEEQEEQQEEQEEQQEEKEELEEQPEEQEEQPEEQEEQQEEKEELEEEKEELEEQEQPEEQEEQPEEQEEQPEEQEELEQPEEGKQEKPVESEEEEEVKQESVIPDAPKKIE